MRADMSKVLVEEPRHGRAAARALVGARRCERQRPDRDGESARSRFGMAQGGGSKHFGEHLRPLYNWLRQQVDRPWDAVYSELCGTLDRRSVVQNHLFQHLYDEVEAKTEWRDGEVWVVQPRWGDPRPLSESYAELYVHPRTGILLVNRAGAIARKKRREAQRAHAAEGHADRRCGLPGMAPDTVCERIEGVWYLVTLAPLGAACQAHPAYDVLLHRPVWTIHHEALRARHGKAGVYAAAKRQLDAKALRRFDLANDA
jgi:hypothetical protein